MISFQVEAYNPQGFLVGISGDDYMEILKAISQHKLTPQAPDVVQDMPKMFTHRIVTVVRRQQFNNDSTVTDVIDCYPRWSKKMGAKRVAYFYLNTDQDRQMFESRSMVSVSEMPIYGGQVALQRKEGQKFPFEVECTPFYVSKTQTGVNDEGNPIYRYEYTDGETPAPNLDRPTLPPGKPAWISDFEQLCADYLAIEVDEVVGHLRDAELIPPDKALEDLGREVVYAGVRRWIADSEVWIDVQTVKVTISKEKRMLWLDCGFMKAVSYSRQPFRNAGVEMLDDWTTPGDYALTPATMVKVKFVNNQYVVTHVECQS